MFTAHEQRIMQEVIDTTTLTGGFDSVGGLDAQARWQCVHVQRYFTRVGTGGSGRRAPPCHWSLQGSRFVQFAVCACVTRCSSSTPVEVDPVYAFVPCT